jgi:glycerophosphoryl diester phosphodiesterase
MTYSIPYLIAHRGYPALYPENSLAGIEAAVQAGACYVEIDIQLSNRRTPFLCHDDHLKRLTGLDIYLTQLDDDEIDALTVPYPESASLSYPASAAPISRLSTFCQYLAKWPHVTAFIEIKAESIDRFGLDETVEAIFQVVFPVRRQSVMISFDWRSVASIRKLGMQRIGWVIRHWDQEQLNIALDLTPDYLFCGTRNLPQKLGELWPGPWQWVVYSVNDYASALKYVDAGILLIETDTIGTLLEFPLLRKI